jgi:hypothetical protein
MSMSSIKLLMGEVTDEGTRMKTTLVVVDSSVAEGIPVESYNEDDRYFFVHH